jgi:hypothetical protein
MAPRATASADLNKCPLSTSKCSTKDISSAVPAFVLRLNNFMENSNTEYKSTKSGSDDKKKTSQEQLRGLITR